jgi:hypothetical protein
MNDLSNCSYVLREQNKPYPRTCKICGLGPFHRICNYGVDLASGSDVTVFHDGQGNIVNEELIALKEVLEISVPGVKWNGALANKVKLMLLKRGFKLEKI